MTFKVDSAACRTVVNKEHKAVRGYSIHRDGKTGQQYGTAKRGGPKIEDEGLRVLQTKAVGGCMPQRIRTRCADVSGALMAVCDLADAGHRVVSDSNEAFALNKASGSTEWISKLPRQPTKLRHRYSPRCERRERQPSPWGMSHQRSLRWTGLTRFFGWQSRTRGCKPSR